MAFELILKASTPKGTTNSILLSDNNVIHFLYWILLIYNGLQEKVLLN